MSDLAVDIVKDSSDMGFMADVIEASSEAVSYTHLTLPTKA